MYCIWYQTNPMAKYYKKNPNSPYSCRRPYLLKFTKLDKNSFVLFLQPSNKTRRLFLKFGIAKVLYLVEFFSCELKTCIHFRLANIHHAKMQIGCHDNLG